MRDELPILKTAIAAGLFLVLGLFIADICISQDNPLPASWERTVSNAAFSVGEQLEFEVEWGPMNVGSATMAVSRTTRFNGRDVYEINTHAQSNKYLSKIYAVQDKYTSFTDTAGLFSVGFTKDLNEGSWQQNRSFAFDHREGLAYSDRDTVDIPQFTHDILSAFYYVRTLELNAGETIDLTYYDNDKVYDLQVHVRRKQKIRTGLGTFECIVVEPAMKTQSLFRNEGKIQIYLTDDERKIPVLVTGKLPFGSIAVKLVKISAVTSADLADSGAGIR